MLEKVTERIYYLMNDDNNERPAIGIVKGEDSCLVVDAGNSPEHGKTMLREVEKRNFPPVKYVIATHHHWDHIFGLEAFDGTKIASEKTCELAKIYNGINLDDKGLELAKEKNIFSAHAIECINKEFQDSGSFAPINFDVAFTGELKLHLGGITCIVNEIINPHREDGTIVYVPEEKTLFLGDAAYGRSKNGRNYYDREKTSALLQEVDTYDAEYYLCSHESICDKEEMQSYWNDLNMGLAMTKGCSSIEEAITNFEKHYNKNPSKNDLFFLESFMD